MSRFPLLGAVYGRLLSCQQSYEYSRLRPSIQREMAEKWRFSSDFPDTPGPSQYDLSTIGPQGCEGIHEPGGEARPHLSRDRLVRNRGRIGPPERDVPALAVFARPARQGDLEMQTAHVP